jgi:hypothetical protein
VIIDDVNPLTRMKYVPGVEILKQNASAGGGGRPTLSVLSTCNSTVAPSGAIKSRTTSVPTPSHGMLRKRPGSPSALMKRDEPALANTE